MPPESAKAGHITFYSYWLPTLAQGAYSVLVKPELTVQGKGAPTSSVSETFHVGGPRYALTGSEAYSCHPAPGQVGQFADALPHIVFDRCTLPWEHTIDGTDPTAETTDDQPCPWLALILLTDADFSDAPTPAERRVPPIVTRKLAELRSTGEDGVESAQLTLEPYDSEEDLCQTIDLPAKVFATIMPRKRDLPYLAHVREVETSDKETWSLLKEGKFSVVVCNRFPETEVVASGAKDWGIVNTMCLVSLEGWGDSLNDPGADIDSGKTFRLLVLGSWRFTCQGSSSFKSQMQRLDDSRLLGRPPLESNGDQDPAFEYVQQALKMGFAPVNHDLRNEDKTISWYRGPLVPMQYELSMEYFDISCADAVLRYEPQSGMFDASFAAAWQLGRLLAMQDQAFAQTLFRFRSDYQNWIRTINTAALDKAKYLQRNLGKCEAVRDWLHGQLTAAGYSTSDRSAAPTGSPDPPPIPATVQNWVGQAMLLYGVPFDYLVPDPEMLPAESIRFFYVNPEWISCLLQGACSVGRKSEADELADQLLRARYFAISEKLASELRSSAKRDAELRRVGSADQDATAPGHFSGWENQSEPVLHWPLSGYLLRSSAVGSWVGLEAKAKGKDSAGNTLDRLQILRMDRLAHDVLLCIYNGKVTEIEVRQPPEAIHFGAASKLAGGHEKTGLRKITGDAQTIGDVITSAEPETVEVPSYGQRVVNVAQLAAKFKQELTDGDVFGSAEFALEMTESPAKVVFAFPEPKAK
jgi:hypothetical protein